MINYLNICKITIFCIFIIFLFSNYAISSEDIKFIPEEIERLENGDIIKDYQYIKETSIHRGHGVGIIDAPIELAWSIITDFNNYPEFTPSIVKSRIVRPELIEIIKSKPIKTVNELENILGDKKINTIIQDPNDRNKFYVYHYQRSNLPWPINDRWTILKMDHDKSIWKQEWQLVVGDIKEDFGSWQFFKHGEDKTICEYTTNLNLGIPIPKFIIGFIMDITGPGLIKGLRNRAKDLTR